MNRFNLPQNISDEILVSGIINISLNLIKNGLYLSNFSLYHLGYDEKIHTLTIKNRRKIRASTYKIEYIEHPDFVDDIDSFYGRLKLDLKLLNKESLYDTILNDTLVHLHKN